MANQGLPDNSTTCPSGRSNTPKLEAINDPLKGILHEIEAGSQIRPA
jgi:hypothetical protein